MNESKDLRLPQLSTQLNREDELALIGMQKKLHEERVTNDTEIILQQARHLKHVRGERLKVEAHAGRDALTGLCNRGEFNYRLINAVALARRHKHNLALAILDLDDLKTINDEQGHPVGDKVLVRLATILKQVFRETDTIARIGGDEYAVILEAMSKRGAKRATERLKELLKENTMSISGGLAYFEGESDSEDDLYARADEAMYKAKSGGKNGFYLTRGKGSDKKFIKLY